MNHPRLVVLALSILFAAWLVPSAQAQPVERVSSASIPYVLLRPDPQPGSAGTLPVVASVAPQGWVTGPDGLSHVVIRFSEDVLVSDADLEVLDGSGSPLAFESSYEPFDHELTISLVGVTENERVRVILDYSITDVFGNELDGEIGSALAPLLPSGDGVRGGQTVLQWNVIAGDATRDGVVDVEDRFAIFEALGAGAGDFGFSPAADVNGDGFVNVLDIATLLNNIGAEIPLGDGSSPAVVSTTPEDGASFDGGLSEFAVTLNEPLDPSTLSPRRLFVVDSFDELRPASGVALSPDGLTATFTFSPALAPCDVFAVGLSNAVADGSGALLSSERVSFLIDGLVVPPSPTIEAAAAMTSGSTVFIEGDAPNAAVVEIAAPGGVIGPITVEDGRYAATVPITPNAESMVFVTSISACGIRSNPVAEEFSSDAEAPRIFIDFPGDGAMLQTNAIDVAGRVGDRLSGFEGLTVRVNGREAEVDIGIGTNGTFLLENLTLETSGPTVITAEATDAFGNVSTTQITVTRVEIPAGSPRMEIVSGGGQEGEALSELAQPLTVRMLRGDGSPLAGKLVTFRVKRSDGRLAGESGAESASMVHQVQTDSQGLARAYWRLGSDAGCGNNRVEATSRDIAGSIFFCASATAKPADRILIGDMNNQIVAAGASLAMPLRAFVADGINGVGGVPVTFTIVEGDGALTDPVTRGSASEVTVLTAESGHAEVYFAVGQTPGRNLVEATFEANPGLPATFIATGIERRTGAPTTLTGTVFDNANRPIGGVTMKLEIAGAGPIMTTTDVDGVFEYSGIPDGPAHLVADGTTGDTLAGEPVPLGTFPFVGYDFTIVPNAENRLNTPVLLPQRDPDNQFVFDGSRDVAMTVDGIEGLRFTVRQETTVTLADGTEVETGSGESVLLTLDQVHFDEIPMPMPDGASFPFAWTLQPKGATFDPPIEVEMPNMAGLPAGSVMYVLQWDGELNEFVIAASGTVSSDGALMRSDSGAGITVAGWGGACPPYPQFGEICDEGDVPECVSGDCEGEGRGGTLMVCCRDACPPMHRRQSPTNCDCVPVVCGEGVSENSFIRNPLNWPAGRTSYNLRDTICNDFTNGFYNREGDVPGQALQRANTHRHVWWQAVLTRLYGLETAREWGDRHEIDGGGTNRSRNRDVNDLWVDLYNNEIGRNLGVANPSASVDELKQLALELVEQAEMRTGDPMFGTDPLIAPPYGPGMEPDLLPESTRDRILDFIPMGVNCEDGGSRSEASDLPRGVAAGILIVPNEQPMRVGQSRQIRVFRIDGDLEVEITGDTDVLAYAEDDVGVISTAPNGVMIAVGPGSTVVSVIARSPQTGETVGYSQFSIVVGTASDGDFDGVPDKEEINMGLDPLDPFDVSGDVDGDGLQFIEEMQIGTDPMQADTDFDGADDGEEVRLTFTSPLVPDPFLPEGAIVEFRGRSARVSSSGAFRIRAVPADDSLNALRATYQVGDEQRYVLSAFVRIDANQIQSNLDLFVSETPFLTVVALDTMTPQTLLMPGDTVVIGVQATLNDGTTADVGLPTDGTSYGSSNPAVASVDRDGLLTASGDGVAFITASNQGVSAVRRIDVAAETIEATITGVVQLQDGSPAAGADVTTLPFGGSAVTDAIGRFELSLTVPADAEAVTVRATLEDGGAVHVGSAVGVILTDFMVSDAGVITLVRQAGGRLCPEQRFEAGDAPGSVAIGDLNGDGIADLAVANVSSDDVSVLLGLGGGAFVPQQRFGTGTDPVSVAIQDLNGDGVPDITTAHSFSDDVSVLLGNGDGTFSEEQRFSAGDRPRSIAIGDLNSDGAPDLVVANAFSDDVSVLLGNGDGSFSIQRRIGAGRQPRSVAIGDLDGDNFLDLVVANGISDDVSVLLGLGDGTFAADMRFSAGDFPVFVAIGDLDSDGVLDLVIANAVGDDISVLLGEGDGTFAADQRFTVGNNPGSVAIEDLNGDGAQDLVATNNLSDNVSMLLGVGDGTFGAEQRLGTGDAPESVAIGDLNGDGAPDLAVVNINSDDLSIFFSNMTEYPTGFVWQRSLDYMEGNLDNSTANNPNYDQLCSPVWLYGWARQSEANSSAEWYELEPTRMLWSEQWFGRPELARWQRANEGSPVIDPRQIAQANIFGSQDDFVPIVTWTNPTGRSITIDIAGPASVRWGFRPDPGAIEVVVAHRANATGQTTTLFSQDFDKPTNDQSAETVTFSIDIPSIMIAPDDQIIFAMRKLTSMRFDENIVFDDRNLQIRLVESPVRSRPTASFDDGSGHRSPLIFALRELADAGAGTPRVLNVHGQRAGSLTLKSAEMPAIIEPDGRVTPIEIPDAVRGEALAINDAGQAAGWYETAAGEVRAFRWTPGQVPLDLGALGGGLTVALAISKAGDVAGYALDAHAIEHAFLYTDTEGLRRLGNLGGGMARGLGVAENDSGMVVGAAQNALGDLLAFAWTEEAGMVDLNAVLPDDAEMTLTAAEGFDDDGGVIARSTSVKGNRRVRLEIEVLPTALLAGDLDRDGVVTATDLRQMIAVFGTPDVAADLDGDGLVTGADLSMLISNWGAQ